MQQEVRYSPCRPIDSKGRVPYMGCSFYFDGIVPEPAVQEKIITFVRQYFTDIDISIQPDPDTIYRTLFVSPEENTEADYPFDYYGVIPMGDPLLPHGQLVFDRTAGGQLVRFLKLPDSYEAGEDSLVRYAKKCKVAITKGGYNREGLGIAFSLLLHVIKLRWYPALEMDDGCYVCEKTGARIWEYGLAQRLADEKLDFNTCRKIFFDELDRRNPPRKREPDQSKQHLRIVDTVAIDTPIEDLELSVRTGNCLKAMKLKTVGDLLEYSASDLVAQRNFGRKSLHELELLLEEFGLYLKKE